MHILMTRPEPDASLSAERLRALGYDVTVDPVLVTRFSEEPIFLPPQAVFAVTSRNGVRALSALADDGMRDVPLYVVGDASAALARQAGFRDVKSASGAVDDLVSLLLENHVSSVAYICGRDRKGDLDGKLEAKGISAVVVERYFADMSPSLLSSTKKGLADGQFDAVLLYSERSARCFWDLSRDTLLSQSTKSILFFCLAKSVAAVFHSFESIRCYTAAEPNENALFHALQVHKNEA